MPNKKEEQEEKNVINNKNNNDKNFFIKIIILIILILIPVGLNFYQTYNQDTTDKQAEFINKKFAKNIHISDFEKFLKLENKNVIKVIFSEIDYANYFQIIVKNHKDNKLDYYKVYKNADEKWKDFKLDEILKKFNLKKGGVGILNENAGKTQLADIITILVTTIFYGAFIAYLLYMTGILKKSPLTLFKPNPKNKISFDDIGGLESNKAEIIEIVDMLKNFKNFKERGVRAMRGILFYGPPGTGKTMLAKAIASQVGVDIFIASANDFGSKYINEGPQKVKKSFKEIENFISKHKKEFAILFVDELDSILKQRGKGGHSEDDKVVNAFLDRIDGIEGSKNIILIGATNYLETIDEASLSRFDRKIGFKLPTKTERLDIIKKIINKRKAVDKELRISENINWNFLADYMQGKSGRDIEILINELHRKSILYKKDITNEFLSEIIMDILLGKKNVGVKNNETEVKTISYHELGHAFIAHINKDLVYILTIESRGSSLGSAWMVPPEDINLHSEEYFLKSIQGLVAGRMAEQIFLGKITTGASNDYERATKLAESYFKDFNFEYKGFSLGYILNKNNNENPMIESEIFSQLNKHISLLIKDQEKIVTKIIKKNRKAFEKLFVVLSEKKTIYREDFIKYLGV